MTGPAQQIEWYLARDGQQYGPVSEDELRKIIELGHLKNDDLVWRAGFAEWRQAEQVFPQELIEKPASPQPSPPQARPNPTQAPAGQPAAHSPQHAGPDPRRHGDPRVAGGAGAPRGRPQDRSGARPMHPQRSGQPGPDAGGVGGRDMGGGPDLGGRDRGSPGMTGQPSARSHPGGPGQSGGGSQFAPRDKRHVVEAAGVAARIEEARSRERPLPDDVNWSVDAPAGRGGGRRQQGQGGRRPKAAIERPAEYGHDFDDHYDAERQGRGRSKTAVVLWSVLLAVLVGAVSAAGWLAYTNADAASRLYSQFLGSASEEPTIVTAPRDQARVAPENTDGGSPPDRSADREPERKTVNVTVNTAPPAERPVQPPTNTSPEPPASVLFATPLWEVFKTGFPEWAGKLGAKAKTMKAAGAAEGEISIMVLRSMVELRRSNSAIALAAPAERLQDVAQSFVSNLKFLRKSSVEACYGFIAEGPLSKTVLPMLVDPSRSGPLPKQSIAILRAIQAGRATKAQYAAPKRGRLRQAVVRAGQARLEPGRPAALLGPRRALKGAARSGLPAGDGMVRKPSSRYLTGISDAVADRFAQSSRRRLTWSSLLL